MFDLDDGDDTPTLTDVRTPRPRILVADDDDTLRDLISARLRREAFEILEAGSGHEVLDLLGRAARDDDGVDLLVMDVRMPGPSGIDITRALRAARWPTPVLLITAFPDPALVAEARALGAAVLAKPFGLDHLSDATIDALLAQREAD